MICFDVDGETTALSEDPGLARRRTLMSQCEYGPRIGVRTPRIVGPFENTFTFLFRPTLRSIIP